MPRKSDKRERLIESAKSLMFRQGFNLTTLADIAQEADVPLGNVYYYFKTKESIGDAVIAHCHAEMNQKLLGYDAMSSAEERLRAYVQDELSDRGFLIRYGDKIGSLCQELAKQGGPLATAAGNLLRQSLTWIAKQYAEMGCDAEMADKKARLFMARMQGMVLVAATTRRAEYLDELSRWLSEGEGTHSSMKANVEERVEAYA